MHTMCVQQYTSHHGHRARPVYVGADVIQRFHVFVLKEDVMGVKRLPREAVQLGWGWVHGR